MTAPNLLALQTESFDWFLGNDAWKQRVEAAASGEGKHVPTVSGLQEVLNEMSPIEDAGGTMSLSFNSYTLEDAPYTIDECRDKDLTYDAPLCVEAEFIMNETGEIKNQTVFLGNFPLMTPRGTFIINAPSGWSCPSWCAPPGCTSRKPPTRPRIAIFTWAR